MTNAAPSTHWAPPPGDLAPRVIDWFRRNPDESLSTEDIAAKFDWPPLTVTAQLRPAVKKDILTIRRRYNQPALFSAGPAIDNPPEPAEAPPPARRRGTNPPPTMKRLAARPNPPPAPHVHVATHGAALPAGLVVHVHVHLGGMRDA